MIPVEAWLRKELKTGPEEARKEAMRGKFKGKQFTCANPMCSAMLLAAWLPAKCPLCGTVTGIFRGE